MVGDREKCLAAGCDDYLAKPVLMSGLRELLKRYLGQTAVARRSLQASRQPRPVGRSRAFEGLGAMYQQEMPSAAERLIANLSGQRPFGPEHGF